MTIQEQLIEKLRQLPAEKQKQVLEFVDSLQKESGPPRKLRSLEGLLEGFNINITDEGRAEARREMWGNFPRDIS